MEGSMADTPGLENKMGETAKSNPVLEVSVSFGRFENDVLSWEKFSSFSPNKYLEEVEKCATPGSVAQKKAYFEAHYKKIAARKAELMNQEKLMGNDSFSPDHDHQNGDLVGNNGMIASGFPLDDTQHSAEAVNKQVKLDNDISNIPVDEPNEDNVECQSSSVQEVKEELDGISDNPEFSKPEETAFRKELEEAPLTGSQGNKEVPQVLGKGTETTVKYNERDNKFDNTKESQKVSNEEVKLDDNISNIHIVKPNEDNEVNVECQTSSVQEAIEELDNVSDGPELSKPEDTVFRKVLEEEPSTGSQGNKKLPQELGKETETTVEFNGQNKKLHNGKESQKVAPISKEKNMGVLKKKTTLPLTKAPHNSTHGKTTKAPQFSTSKALTKGSPISIPKVSAGAPQVSTPKVSTRAPEFSSPRKSTKSPNISTPKVTKPKTSSAVISTSTLSTKKGIGSSLSTSKNSHVGEIKKMTSKSLHMSLSLGPSNSDSASGTTTRKPYIMEKMGDKDIVKRAFKTFQAKFNQLKSSGEEISSGAKQIAENGATQKIYTPTILRKENGGSLKAGQLDKRTTEAAPSSYGLRIHERVEKQRKEKVSEIKMPRHSLNFRATATSELNLGQKTSKISLDEGGSKKLGL